MLQFQDEQVFERTSDLCIVRSSMLLFGKYPTSAMTTRIRPISNFEQLLFLGLPIYDATKGDPSDSERPPILLDPQAQEQMERHIALFLFIEDPGAECSIVRDTRM
jgi:hypothetical protein